MIVEIRLLLRLLRVALGSLIYIYFFADDLLLLAKANTRNSEAILGVLDSFCGIFGQKISKGKFRIVFSPNVDAQSKISICNKLGIRATCEIGRYLGFPISIRVIIVMLSTLLLIKSSLSWPGGRPKYYPLQVD